MEMKNKQFCDPVIYKITQSYILRKADIYLKIGLQTFQSQKERKDSDLTITSCAKKDQDTKRKTHGTQCRIMEINTGAEKWHSCNSIYIDGMPQIFP